ncbi:MAG: peroxiredoxin [Bacteroidetes bacterium]|nr:peroxiredoxin [Bacteroidota bacterium]
MTFITYLRSEYSNSEIRYSNLCFEKRKTKNKERKTKNEFHHKPNKTPNENMLQVGQKAPGFKLLDTEKNEVTLEQFKGKNLVIFFFPMAWTGGCTKEMCAIQEDYNGYSELNANVIGISIDTFFALKHFAADNKITYPLLSDFNKETIKAYDVVHHEFAFGYKDVAKRSTFVLDTEGTIRFIEILFSPGDFPNMDAIKAAVQSLK